MTNSRRTFLTNSSFGLLGVAMTTHSVAQTGESTPAPQTTPEIQTTPGAPTAFGTSPAFGPEVAPATFEVAEKLVEVTLTGRERAEAAGNWRNSVAPVYERRTGPRKLAIESEIAPWSRWDPILPGTQAGPAENRFVRSAGDDRPLPERVERFDPKLHCVITVTKELALAQAAQADKEIAAGHYRGPLHGIPWGAKDLLDTSGIYTTYGAEPFRNRVPAADATVVERLHAAGAVLIAKLSMGALALNDIWFGGETRNPWVLEEGSSGSSAGPGAATAAGLVSFAIGSETGGSIVSPTMRCGLTGLRPTFGRVPRTGAMTLCWSLDKLGAMTRSVEDTMLVLDAITGPDGKDLSSVPSRLDFDASRAASSSVKGLRVG